MTDHDAEVALARLEGKRWMRAVCPQCGVVVEGAAQTPRQSNMYELVASDHFLAVIPHLPNCGTLVGYGRPCSVHANLYGAVEIE